MAKLKSLKERRLVVLVTDDDMIKLRVVAEKHKASQGKLTRLALRLLFRLKQNEIKDALDRF